MISQIDLPRRSSKDFHCGASGLKEALRILVRAVFAPSLWLPSALRALFLHLLVARVAFDPALGAMEPGDGSGLPE